MKKILSFTMVILMMLMLFVFAPYVGAETERKNKYEVQVVELLDLTAIYKDYLYEELFEYYATTDEISAQDSEPEYVLVFAASTILIPTESESDVFGDHVVYSYATYNPYSLGYHIYIPETNEIYTLREAWDLELKGIEAIFNECEGFGRKIGDATNDGKIDIRDATHIQKMLAGISEIEYDAFGGISEIKGYISDFNRDGERNIKDATAIQKKIAGLPY